MKPRFGEVWRDTADPGTQPPACPGEVVMWITAQIKPEYGEVYVLVESPGDPRHKAGQVRTMSWRYVGWEKVD